MGWSYLGIFMIVAAVLTAVGFYRYVYFLSVGYGLAIAGLGITIAVIFHGDMTVLNYLQCLLLLTYGVRLSGFLIIREAKNAAYRKTLEQAAAEAASGERSVPFFVKLAIWLSVCVLYVAQVSPVFYRVYNGLDAGALPWIGLAISAAALVLESAADHQKTVQKAARPDMTATKGLYKLVRCPNYFGEILFWTGVTVGGLTALRGAGQWIAAIAAYVSIVGIMFSGAKRLEKRQSRRYGKDPEYRAYADKTPIIIPFIPLYHLYKEKKDEK